MAAHCALCGKGKLMGLQHTHHPGVAGGRWKKRAPHTVKIFRPNLHPAHMTVNGTRRKVYLCTKCQRIVKAQEKAAQEVQKSSNRVLTA